MGYPAAIVSRQAVTPKSPIIVGQNILETRRLQGIFNRPYANDERWQG
jgi:hypothetical protein